MIRWSAAKGLERGLRDPAKYARMFKIKNQQSSVDVKTGKDAKL